ncbi:MAG: hypothetical protein MUP81_00800 [Dehalococcoidia bacterium]|nr:hypothetical protein [Dehalococcoidia bacterium]
MVILKSLPETAIISGFKGSVDFYEWMGLPVARRWPRSPSMPRIPAVEAQWPAFTTAAKEWALLSPFVQAAYRSLAESSGMCDRDLQMRGYLSGLYRYEVP